MPPQDFSNDRDCQITSVDSMEDSQYGKKVKFRIEGYPHQVSTFTKWPEKIVVGGVLFGHIEVKDGKYHNFRFGKKGTGSAPTSDGAKNYLEFKVMPMLEAIRDDVRALRKKQIEEEDASIMPHDADGIPF